MKENVGNISGRVRFRVEIGTNSYIGFRGVSFVCSAKGSATVRKEICKKCQIYFKIKITHKMFQILQNCQQWDLPIEIDTKCRPKRQIFLRRFICL